MQLANIDLGKLFVSKTNMRHGTKPPDVSDILATVKARGVIVPLIVRAGEDEGMVVPDEQMRHHSRGRLG